MRFFWSLRGGPGVSFGGRRRRRTYTKLSPRAVLRLVLIGFVAILAVTAWNNGGWGDVASVLGFFLVVYAVVAHLRRYRRLSKMARTVEREPEPRARASSVPPCAPARRILPDDADGGLWVPRSAAEELTRPVDAKRAPPTAPQ